MQDYQTRKQAFLTRIVPSFHPLEVNTPGGGSISTAIRSAELGPILTLWVQLGSTDLSA
jgi:hypothetical protein